MKPFGANMLTLFQCGPLWFWHIMAGFLCVPALVRPLVYPEAGQGYFCGELMVSLWAGIMAMSLAKDILVKPFASCLPAHGAVVRRVLIAIGIMTGVIGALPFLIYPGLTVIDTLLTVWSAFAFGITAYCLGVLIMLQVRNSGFVGFCIMLMFGFTFADLTSTVRAGLEGFTIAYPLASSAPALLCFFLAWRRFSAPSFSRSFCAQNYLAPIGLFNAVTVVNFHEIERASRIQGRRLRLRSYLERIVLSKMTNVKEGTRRAGGRYLWGNFYTLVGNSIPDGWMKPVWIFMLIAAGAIFLGFAGPLKDLENLSRIHFLLLFPGILVGTGLPINFKTGILVPVGRKERFASLLFGSLISVIVVAVVSLLVIILSHAIDMWNHEILLFGSTYTYMPIVPKVFFFFFLSLPFFLICQLLFRRYIIVPMIILFIAICITFDACILGFLAMSPLGIAVITVACWIPFLLVTYNICFHRDLVLNG